MLCPFLIKNYYPFDKNLEIKYFNDFLNKIIKIQRWFRYYNVKHILFHKNNNTQLILTKFNMIKIICLYLKNPQYNYFKEKPLLHIFNERNKYVQFLFSLKDNKFKVYSFLKKIDTEILKTLYFYIKNI